jgi:gluconate 2-dehydrogenase gamma chain
MSSPSDSISGRREFLRQAATVAGLVALPGAARAASEPAAPTPTNDSAVGAGWLCFSPDEAAWVERLVDVMCPADELSPRGVDCGLAVFFDRQLAGAYGRGERLYLQGPWRTGLPQDGYQLPLTPEQYFKIGLKAAAEAARARHDKGFAELSMADADSFLQLLASGQLPHPHVDLAHWFDELVYPLFQQACFSDPIYGGNRDRVFWKMIGYPGLPAVNGLNMAKYRGKPFPGAKTPRSIEDFS